MLLKVERAEYTNFTKCPEKYSLNWIGYSVYFVLILA